MRARVVLAIAVVCGALAGCNYERTWSAKAISPDGQFVATAATARPGGWGTASPPTTAVKLNWTHGSQSAALIFQIRAEKEGSDGPDLLNVGMQWSAPNRLVLTYSASETVVFQAVKCDGIDIETKAVSRVAPGGTSPTRSSATPGRLSLRSRQRSAGLR